MQRTGRLLELFPSIKVKERRMNTRTIEVHLLGMVTKIYTVCRVTEGLNDDEQGELQIR